MVISKGEPVILVVEGSVLIDLEQVLELCASVVPPFQRRLDLVAFFLGELRVVSHRCLSCLLV